MRNKKQCYVLLLLLSSVVLLYYFYRTKKGLNRDIPFQIKLDAVHEIPQVTIAVVACKHRLYETINMIKSAILFNQAQTMLKVIVIAEADLIVGFQEKLGDWQLLMKTSFIYDVLPLTFPATGQEEWKNLFKPCAAQRLFLPSMLNTTDSVLYLDTDTLFLSPVLEIWKYFSEFNSTQLAGLSPEHEDPNVGWYNRFAQHPFYGALGVNSGVMLMNLTRMRAFKWEEKILPIYKDYRLKITWGDQDIINILFYFHPERLFVFNCEWNYRPDHCMYMSVCKAPTGVKIIHGNRGYFHADKQPAFSAIYQTYDNFRLESENAHQFLYALETLLDDPSVSNSNCGKVRDKFLQNPRQQFYNISILYESLPEQM